MSAVTSCEGVSVGLGSLPPARERSQEQEGRAHKGGVVAAGGLRSEEGVDDGRARLAGGAEDCYLHFDSDWCGWYSQNGQVRACGSCEL